VAKGARGLKSPFQGKLDLYYLADLSFRRSRRSELHLLREVVLKETHSALRKNLQYLAQAAYCGNFLELGTEREAPLPALFGEFAAFLEFLGTAPPTPAAILSWEMKVLGTLGLDPPLDRSKLSAGSAKLLEKFAGTSWSELHRFKPTVGQIREMREFLHGFIIYHLGRLPAGRSEALREQPPSHIVGVEVTRL
jgi:DNA repair protein RecO (recombination protein O)